MPVQDRFQDLSELRSFRLFEHFTDNQLAVLYQATRHERLAEKEVVYAEGQAGDDFYVIVAGGVEAYRETMVGRQPVARLRVGQVFGEDSFVDGDVRSATVVGVQGGLLLRVDGAQARMLIGSLKGFDVALLRSFWHALAAKVRQANAFMAEIAASGHEAPQRGPSERGEQVNLQPSAKLGLFQEQGLGTAELRLLATTLPAERFAPDAMIFFEGELGDSLYIVVDGEVRISRRLSGMGEETLAILGRGEVFGEMALIDELPRSADARSHFRGCTVLRLTRNDLDELLGLETAASAFLGLLCRLLTQRYRAMINHLITWRVMAGFS
jgi:CRP-like cAMP-binding protein